MSDPHYTFAVDWDGTCVEQKWPEMGEWLPGAVAALRELDSIGEVVIHTCRVAPIEYPHRADRSGIWRDESEVGRDIAAVKAKLAEVGLGHLEVWTRPYKPSALVYIDDKAIDFDGSWESALFRTFVAISEYLATSSHFAEGGCNVSSEAIIDRDPGDEDDAALALAETLANAIDEAEYAERGYKCSDECSDECLRCVRTCQGCEGCCECEPRDEPRLRDWLTRDAVREMLAHAKAHRRSTEDGGVHPSFGSDEHRVADLGFGSEVRYHDLTTGGMKGEKACRIDLIPVLAQIEEGKVFGFGAGKYRDEELGVHAEHNWRRGYPWSKSIAAADRHWAAFKAGEDHDPESTLLHLAHLRWHTGVLIEFYLRRLGADDRIKVKRQDRDAIEEAA